MKRTFYLRGDRVAQGDRQGTVTGIVSNRIRVLWDDYRGDWVDGNKVVITKRAPRQVRP
jgi:hypothetical protein